MTLQLIALLILLGAGVLTVKELLGIGYRGLRRMGHEFDDPKMHESHARLIADYERHRAEARLQTGAHS